MIFTALLSSARAMNLNLELQLQSLVINEDIYVYF